ncbi:MAG TPA: AAA family ATPase [Candidatus Deferrimicrobiaceae bacterium]|jgi:5-methylcytosine-specific restriction protein B
MSESGNPIGTRPCWLVGAAYGGNDDQMSRFLSEGIWETGYENKYADAVRSMQPGDRIAIKATYTRKQGLPFDNKGQSVSVMAIKAVGTVTGNLDDGKRVKVDWKKLDPVREWYFFTYQKTLWRVLPDTWMREALIAFAFDGKPQDIQRFCNSPGWVARFGTVTTDRKPFAWTRFYEAVADKLLAFREDRGRLVEGIREISSRIDVLGYLKEDHFADSTSGFVRDICPFTAMGLFNRGITVANRKAVAAELARFLGVEEPVPESFDGVPLLNNLKSWYFPFEADRTSDHIDSLWNVFATAIRFAESDDDAIQQEFLDAFDDANGRPGVGWNLTFGLFWTRPWYFPSLDANSRNYLSNSLRVPIDLSGAKGRCGAKDYLALKEAMEAHFQEPSYPVHSFPELSRESWLYKSPAGKEDEIEVDDPDDVIGDASREKPPIVPYAVDDILKEGCFLGREEIEGLLGRLRSRKNLILQGPPGTGKSWLAKRLAYALMGEKDDSKVRAVQFHPNLSYEDFVRGWRPTGDGRLALADGVFMEAINAALRSPTSIFVVVIEEFNRGNPAQIFGELLTVLEAGKRTPNEALELCYPDADGKRRPIHVPENLYLIGTMNIADRSLALVDLALRRRFAFVGLEPKLGETWREWVVKERNVDQELAKGIEGRIKTLNDQIGGDPRLGKQFRIGHSYVTPAYRLEEGDTLEWFRQVVRTEIGPLLEEYWFDSPEDAAKASEKLLHEW